MPVAVDLPRTDDLSIAKRRRPTRGRDAELTDDETSVLLSVESNSNKDPKGLFSKLKESASRAVLASKYTGNVADKDYSPPQHDRLAVLVFTALAFATRFFRIASGKWDEAHFGKFGSHYLKGTFYFDVHPPLGKMLVGLAGYVAGYNGTYEFGSGQTYPEWVNFVGMRMFLASFSALAVPYTYMTAVQLGLSRPVSYLVGLMALLGTYYDVGFIGIGRIILLDSMLIFFTTVTTFYYCLFRNQKPFTAKWWSSLLMTGVNIGCVTSVKWVGFFVTALVGLMTIEELWGMLGDTRFVKHFAARALCLILVPIAIYIGSFYAHFSILRNSGPGDANMSSLFQASLNGSDLSSSPVDVAYGSIVTVKNNAFGGGLLHSHIQTYPGGSKQQQVTCYHHKDLNNEWRIIKKTNPRVDYDKGPIEFVQDGDIVRLQHTSTGRNLHSHAVEAPVTKGEFEVSGYGNYTLLDPNDLWIVEVESGRKSTNDKILHSLSTQFRLRHQALGCYLRANNKHLPEWGFKQIEVTCDKKTKKTDRTVLWNIESQKNDRLPKGDPSKYKSVFWKDFIDCNVGMFMTNNALTPNPDHEPGIITSLPRHWWWMTKGIRMSSWDASKTKFFMLGTPTVWWGGSVATVVLGLIVLGLVLLNQRKIISVQSPEYQRLLYQIKISLGGWALHYLPFFLMGRVTYVHHYYPALIYGVLCFGVVYNAALQNRSNRVQLVAAGIYGLLTVINFIYFSPMAYGMNGPASAYKGRQWMKSWNLY